MRLNENKFFELAKQNKFEAADLSMHRSYSQSISLFHSEVDSFSENDSYIVTGRGIINGKFGVVTTEAIDKNTPQFLIDGIIKTASIIETNDPSIIFKGSDKYHKKSVFCKDLLGKPVQNHIDLLVEIEKKLLNYDKRINEVACVGYSEDLVENCLSNSYGLKLKSKSSSISIYAEVTAKQGDEIRTGFHVFASNKEGEFNIDKFIESVANDALKKLGSKQCKSKKYPVILNQKSFAQLLNAYLSNIDAEEVQKQSSLFIGKLHNQIASPKLTVIENPLEKNIFFRYFDDEGVATNKKFIIKKGNLETYIYTLQTAAIDGVEPTGNGIRGSGKAHAELININVKPGKKTFDEMIRTIKEGVYITEFQGLHSGLNSQSGNFSLQSSGFMIENGKVTTPLSLVTTAGNLVDLFNNIKCLSNDSEFIIGSATTTPSVYIKKLSISGK